MSGAGLDWERELSATDLRALDAAFRDLVRLVGGVENAGLQSSRDKAQISRYGSPNVEVHAPVDVVARLEAVAGPVVTRALARLAGHVLIPLPPAGGDPEWAGYMARVTKETSDVLVKVSQALSGELDGGQAGTITAAESRALGLRAEIAEAIEKLAELDHGLKRLETPDAQRTAGGAAPPDKDSAGRRS
ncbi:hypothetical protein [Minwuia thermotolerans]|uniref:Uncharacterized protein n=1 Tax=Minwuia thermotolerans TaxID=2056226 RepID=A0A2M9G2I3_9PROT|nr:hypothetical protein [Minwuia thermotolerans]PJK29931.1 hypothetical protein CVT23_09180 [Minwuia thermotolerans]